MCQDTVQAGDGASHASLSYSPRRRRGHSQSRERRPVPLGAFPSLDNARAGTWAPPLAQPLLLHAGVGHRLIRRPLEYVLRIAGISVLLCFTVYPAAARDMRAVATALEPRDIDIVRGRVARVRTLLRAGGGGRDVTLVLRTDIGDEIPVAVAPRRVVHNMGLRLRSGEEIEVVGWRIVRGKPALLAAELVAGGRLFVLRDRYGNPAWRP